MFELYAWRPRCAAPNAYRTCPPRARARPDPCGARSEVLKGVTASHSQPARRRARGHAPRCRCCRANRTSCILDGLLKIALAEAEARAGDLDRALAVLDEGLATAHRIGYRAFEAELHRARGEMLFEARPLPMQRMRKNPPDRHCGHEAARHAQLRTARGAGAGQTLSIDSAAPSKRTPFSRQRLRAFRRRRGCRRSPG